MSTRPVVTVVLTMAALCGLAWQEAVAATKPGEAWRAEVMRLSEPLIDAGIVPSLAIGIYDSSRIETYFLGNVDPSGSGPATPPDAHTVYEIGSVSKVFTALLLADAAQHGQVKLDDPLSTLWPKGVAPPTRDGQEITLEQLATHSSGLPRIPANMRADTLDDPYADYTREKLFAFLDGHELVRAPGSQYEYSNLAVGLLGTLLADKSKSTYDALLRERITGPLGMAETCVRLNDEQQRRLAPPYREGQRVSNWDFDALVGCGGIRSTVGDMVKLLAAHVEPGSTSLAEIIANASRPRSVPKAPAGGMALGWHIAADRSTFWHTGQTGGYAAAVFVNPAERKGVVVLANGADSTVDVLGERIIQAMFGMKVQPPKVRRSITLVDSQLDRLLGDYDSALGFTISVTREGDALMARVTGQQAIRIYPESATRFFYRAVEAEIEFEIDRKSKSASALTLFQHGQEMRCTRQQKH